jgi:hypothetical protein
VTALDVIPEFSETVALALPSGQARIEKYVRQSRAQSTLRGYRSDWREFEAWRSRDPGLSAEPLPGVGGLGQSG